MAMIHINRSGATVGVFDEVRVREGLATGEFIGTDLGWMEGMPTWRPLSELENFRTPMPPPLAPEVAATSASIPVELATTAVLTQELVGLPWENRATKGFFNGLFETIAMVLTRPSEAFSVMRREGNFADPLLYVLIMGLAGVFVSAGYSTFLRSFGALGDRGGLGMLIGAGFGSFFALLLMPVILLVAMFIGGGLIHVCLMIVGGANQSFETTLRVFSYANGSASVFQLIPVCGGIVAWIYSLVLTCIGLSRAHATDTWRAVVAVLLPMLICCGGGMFLVLALIGGIAGAANWH